MRGRQWIPREERALRTLYPHMVAHDVALILGRPVSSIHQRARHLRVNKSAAFRRAQLALQVERLQITGAAHRFTKGVIPPNKGRKGYYAPGCEKGWFKKGQRPANHKELGSLRLSSEGYVDMKVRETKGATAWRHLHLCLWEDAHGKVPTGHMLRFRDGDPFNVDIDNLDLITRAENMRRNTIHNRYPKSLVCAIAHLGQLKRRIREKSGRPERAPVRNA